jgi:hypothetical protein
MPNVVAREASPLWRFMRDMANAGVWPRLARAERQVLPRTERFAPENGTTVTLEDGAALTIIQPAAPLFSLTVDLPVTDVEQKRTIVIAAAIGALQIRSGLPVLGWDSLVDTRGYAVFAFQFVADIGWVRVSA